MAPTNGCKKLQHFLGFASFYQSFIINYSSVAALLTALNSTEVPIWWSSDAQGTLERYKIQFTSAPLLSLPDPSWPFIVEVDASDTGV